MKIVVTGGTGFLGTRLVERLEQDGHEVRVVSRSRGYDVTRLDTLGPVFEGAETVFHLAALVQSRPGPFEDTNVLGLENVLKTCEARRVGRLIYVSSFTVFGPSGDAIHDEHSVPRRVHFFHGYDRSKYHAFRIAEQWKTRLPMNIIFPTVVYGPGPLTEGNIMVRLFQRWRLTRLAPLPDYGKPRWNFVYVNDVVDGMMKCLLARAGEDFILGGSNSSLKELYAAFRLVSGVPMLAAGLPVWCFKASSYLEDWGSQLAGFPPLVLPSTADFFWANWQFSSEKARAQLGYSPCSMQEGLETTLKWMKERRMV
jgi:farnesol dehydrogenase